MKNKTKTLLVVLAAGTALTLVGCKKSSTDTSGSASGGTDSGTTEVVAADGTRDFSAASYSEQSKILGALEKYAMDNHLAGVPVCDDGGLVMFNPRVTLPTTTYVANFGFGTGYGSLKTPLSAEIEPTEAWRSYYHDWTTTDTGTFNAMNASGSDVADFQAMFAASLYGTRLDDNKEGYHWVNELAKQAPVPLDDNGNEDATLTTSKKWRYYVHNNEEGYVYNTPSTTYAAYSGRKIMLDDYITPYKLTLDNKWYRATDLGGDSYGFAGCKNYKKGDDWSTVGIQANAEKGSIDVEFNTVKTQFKAMYGVSDSTFSPIPQEFVDAVTLANFEKVGTNADPYQDVDNVLSTGAYMPSYWEVGKTVVYKKNPLYFDAAKINYEGYKFVIIDSVENAFTDFLAGKIDSCAVPTKLVSQYKTDARTLKTLGSTVMKLNNNACTVDQWNHLFGPNGIVYPHAASYTGYTPKAIMSNANFLDGVYFAMNRAEWATQSGHNAAMAFLSDAYMVDPQSGKGFRNSDDGKAVTADRSPETNGYDVELAGQLFKKAVSEEEAKGTIKAGDKLTIIATYMYQTHIDNIGTYVKKWVDAAWAASGVTDVTLDWQSQLGGATYNDAYNKIMRGETDFMWGAIQGSALDPLNIMNVVCTDNRGGLTLNWGKDTSYADPTLVYANEYYSYDALWSSAFGPTTVTKGAEAKAYTTLAAPSFADKKLTFKSGYTVSGDNDIVPNTVIIEQFDTKTYGSIADFVIAFDADGTYAKNNTAGEKFSVVNTTNCITVTDDKANGVVTTVVDISVFQGFDYVGHSATSANGITVDGADQLYIELDYTGRFNSEDVDSNYYTQTFSPDSIVAAF